MRIGATLGLCSFGDAHVGTSFAAPQCAIRAGDISANLKLHVDFMQHAREQGVGLLLFPSYRSQDMNQPWPKPWRRM